MKGAGRTAAVSSVSPTLHPSCALCCFFFCLVQQDNFSVCLTVPRGLLKNKLFEVRATPVMQRMVLLCDPAPGDPCWSPLIGKSPLEGWGWGVRDGGGYGSITLELVHLVLLIFDIAWHDWDPGDPTSSKLCLFIHMLNEVLLFEYIYREEERESVYTNCIEGYVANAFFFCTVHFAVIIIQNSNHWDQWSLIKTTVFGLNCQYWTDIISAKNVTWLKTYLHQFDQNSFHL